MAASLEREARTAFKLESEHVVRVVSALSARHVDFGFGFSVVVNTLDAQAGVGGGTPSM